MTQVELFTQLVNATAIAAGLLFWACITAMFAPKRWYVRSLLASVSAIVSLSVLRLMLGTVTAATIVASASAVVVLLVCTSKFFWTVSASVIRSLANRNLSRVFALGTILLVGIGWSIAYWHYEETQLAQADAMLSESAARNPPEVVPSTVVGVTDLGQTFSLEVPVQPAELSDLIELEESSTPIQKYHLDYLIRRGPPDDMSNCHGWVFTDGKFNIAGRVVSKILEENNYIAVVQPEPGDLIIYRGNNDEISHSGIVRAVLGKNDVLIESKWGRMGVYLHPADKSCYGTNYEFHHSKRGSHTITMIPGEKDKSANTME